MRKILAEGWEGQDHHFLGEGAPSVRADAARRIIEELSGSGRG